MTPFQQVHVWFRRASGSQRSLATGAALIALVLVGWLVVPVDDVPRESTRGPGLEQTSGEFAPLASDDRGASAVEDERGVESDGPARRTDSLVPVPDDGRTGPEATVEGGAAVPDGSSGASADGAAPASRQRTAREVARAAASPEADSDRTRCPSGTDQGATESEFRAAVTIINIGGDAGNATINVPSPQVQERYWRIVIDSLNAAGGFGCRRMVPTFYSVNPVNASEAQQKCLEIANSRSFLAIDPGPLGAVGASDCIPQSKTPMIAYLLSNAQLKNYYPYYISPNGIVDDTIRNGILGAKQKGHLTKGFRKLGLLYRSCIPDQLRIMRAALREAGIPARSTVEYSLGCPPGAQSNPADWQQAVLTFKNEGVTHVTSVGLADFANFTRAAGQQRFSPQYVSVENIIVATVGNGGTLQPDAENLDGAVAVIPGRYGEEDTPGSKPTGATARCNAIFAAKGEGPVYQQKVGFGGQICSLLFVTQKVLASVPQMRRDLLARNLQSLGTVDLSFPHGPVDFAATPPGAPYGRTAWRTTQFAASCRCYRVVDPTFRPAFR